MATNSNYFFDAVYPKLLVLGDKACHQIDERSFHIGIRKFPVCARCTGIYLGFAIGIATSWLFTIPLLPALIFMLVMILDGYVQMKTRYESTNPRRLITGTLFGWSIVSIAAITVDYITTHNNWY